MTRDAGLTPQKAGVITGNVSPRSPPAEHSLPLSLPLTSGLLKGEMLGVRLTSYIIPDFQQSVEDVLTNALQGLCN